MCYIRQRFNLLIDRRGFMPEPSRREMLEQFVASNPNDSFARYGLAMEFANAAEPEAALREFQKLVELNPDYTAAYQMAAQLLMKNSRNDEARAWLERGLASAARTGNSHARSEMQAMMDEI